MRPACMRRLAGSHSCHGNRGGGGEGEWERRGLGGEGLGRGEVGRGGGWLGVVPRALGLTVWPAVLVEIVLQTTTHQQQRNTRGRGVSTACTYDTAGFAAIMSFRLLAEQTTERPGAEC